MIISPRLRLGQIIFIGALINLLSLNNPPYNYQFQVQHVKDTLPDDDGSTLVTCIAVTSGIGRLIFGKIADLPNVNRIFLQQISFICIGICTMLLTAAPYFKGFEFESMIVFSLIMGIFDGCFITMLGPIAYDICGPAGASQAVGFLLGLCSIPLTIGPAAAGEMNFEHELISLIIVLNTSFYL